jgi:hypothetical protein
MEADMNCRFASLTDKKLGEEKISEFRMRSELDQIRKIHIATMWYNLLNVITNP